MTTLNSGSEITTTPRAPGHDQLCLLMPTGSEWECPIAALPEESYAGVLAGSDSCLEKRQ
jgi:hypothetical protein